MSIFSLNPPPINPALYSSLQRNFEDRTTRQDRMKKAWQAYLGEYDPPLGDLKDKDRKVLPLDVIMSMAQVIVDVGASALIVDDVQFEIDNTTPQRTPQEEQLDVLWEQNDRPTFLQQMAIDGGVCGQVFVRMTLDPAYPYPRFVLIDPSYVDVYCKPDDFQTHVRYVIQYETRDELDRPVLVESDIARDPSGRFWRMTDRKKLIAGGDWIVTNDLHWNFPWSPIFTTQNLPFPHRVFGLSDIDDCIRRLNQSLNQGLTLTRRREYFLSHQKIWGKGFGAGEVDLTPGKIPVFGDDGELNAIPEDANFGSNLDMARFIAERTFMQARVPEIATGKLDNVGQLSALAMQVLYGPLLSKTITKRALYGRMLRNLTFRAMEVARVPLDRLPLLIWKSPLPSDPVAERQKYLLEKELGVRSKASIAAELGIDWEHERPLIESEQAEDMARQAQQAELEQRAFDRGV